MKQECLFGALELEMQDVIMEITKYFSYYYILSSSLFIMLIALSFDAI
jgi:hypothetical protein